MIENELKGLEYYLRFQSENDFKGNQIHYALDQYNDWFKNKSDDSFKYQDEYKNYHKSKRKLRYLDVFEKLFNDQALNDKWCRFIDNRDETISKKRKERLKEGRDANIDRELFNQFLEETGHTGGRDRYEDFKVISEGCDKFIILFRYDLNLIDYRIFQTEAGEEVKLNGHDFEAVNKGLGHQYYVKILKNDLCAVKIADKGDSLLVKDYIQRKEEAEDLDKRSGTISEAYQSKDEQSRIEILIEVQFMSVAVHLSQYKYIFQLFDPSYMSKMEWKQLDFYIDFKCNNVKRFVKNIEIDETKFKDQSRRLDGVKSHEFSHKTDQYNIKVYDSFDDKAKKTNGLHYLNIYLSNEPETCETIMRLELSISKGALFRIKKIYEETFFNKKMEDNSKYDFEFEGRQKFHNCRMYFNDQDLSPFISYLVPFIQKVLINGDFKINNKKIAEAIEERLLPKFTDEIDPPEIILKNEYHSDSLLKQSVGCLANFTAKQFVMKYPMIHENFTHHDEWEDVVSETAEKIYKLTNNLEFIKKFNENRLHHELTETFQTIINRVIYLHNEEKRTNKIIDSMNEDMKYIFNESLGYLASSEIFERMVKLQLKLSIKGVVMNAFITKYINENPKVKSFMALQNYEDHLKLESDRKRLLKEEQNLRKEIEKLDKQVSESIKDVETNISKSEPFYENMVHLIYQEDLFRESNMISMFDYLLETKETVAIYFCFQSKGTIESISNCIAKYCPEHHKVIERIIILPYNFGKNHEELNKYNQKDYRIYTDSVKTLFKISNSHFKKMIHE
jgi:hypothetical protein